MDLSYIDPNSSEDQVQEELKAAKHYYLTPYNQHMSPTNAAFFAFTESSTNVEICVDKTCSRYVAKYAPGVEGRAFKNVVASDGEKESPNRTNCKRKK